MSQNTDVYTFNNVALIFGGVPIRGFYEGDDVIKINRNDDEINTIVGADGGALVSISTDRSALVEVKLMPTSASNAVLTAFAETFRRAGRTGFTPLIITNLANNTAWAAVDAVIASTPKEISLGKSPSMYTWQFFAGCLEGAPLGNL